MPDIISIPALERVNAWPALGCALPFNGFVRYRQARAQAGGESFVLLHGIGSGSGSWIEQLGDDGLGHVLAWDAPGYADSTPLKTNAPTAADYARILWAWLDEMKIGEIHLVGHSLGAIMAAGAARQQAQRVLSLTLVSPAQGYGTASEAIRTKKSQERLQAVADWGFQKMAEQRAPRLLSSTAKAEHIDLAIAMMSKLNIGGYTQATQLLSNADIEHDLRAFRQLSDAPIQVVCGDQDVITPAVACRELAQAIHAPYTELNGAGHLCALEAAEGLTKRLKSIAEK